MFRGRALAIQRRYSDEAATEFERAIEWIDLFQPYYLYGRVFVRKRRFGEIRQAL